MKLCIEITEIEVKDLIKDFLEDKLNHSFKPEKLKIMVKSKQNYKSEWEVADFKATYEEF